MKGFDIHHIEETDSTNLYLKRISRENELPQGYTIYADYQDAGRGQKNTSWESERGLNLLFSTVLFPEKLEAGKQFILSQIISLAVKDVLDKEASGFSVKWPNDIYWENKKIAGILIENEIMGDYISRSVIGVGINLNQEIFRSDAPNPVSLKQITGKNYEIQPLLQRILTTLKDYFSSLNNHNSIKSIREKYYNSLFRKEGFYLYNDGSQNFMAEIACVEDSGLLVLRKETGETVKYAFKQIRFVL